MDDTDWSYLLCLELPICLPSEIKSVKAHQIFDSRGNPTIELVIVSHDLIWQNFAPAQRASSSILLKPPIEAVIVESVFTFQFPHFLAFFQL
ncbi:hypothetical protein V6N12_018877 [Hibiscus sabdariffa]|uniref:Enolase N-terminal domain-containing protein n=1 Tax=Hibiscus sabdariffa TaxID=183260 RepID=A0ABR2ATE4_9ROSI